jgi:hypothetical protein
MFPLRHPVCVARNLSAEAIWIQQIAELCARADSRSDALKLYTWLPAPVRYAVRVLVPQRLRRALVRRLTTQDGQKSRN